MRTAWGALLAGMLAGCCGLGVGASVWARSRDINDGGQPIVTARRERVDERSSASGAGPRSGRGSVAGADRELGRHWDDVKTSLKQGAYRRALQAVEAILAITPDDPRALLYRSLCEMRLGAPRPVAQLSASELAALRERLHGEARAQRHFAAEQEARERQLRREQAQWDQQLKELQRRAEQDEQADRKRRRIGERGRARLRRRRLAGDAARQGAAPGEVAAASGGARPSPPSEGALPRETPVRRREEAEQAVGKAAPPAEMEGEGQVTLQEAVALRGGAPPATPEAGATQPESDTAQHPSAARMISARSSGASVELPRVVVASPGAEPRQPESLTPSLLDRPLPPRGAVQINALQMTVSPDRRVAFAEGNVEVVVNNALMTCDRLTLFTDTKDAYAEGRVRIEQGPQVFRGEMVHYNFETRKGRFLQGTVSSPPWVEHGRSVEHIAEGVYSVRPGYVTSCDLEPPHFRFFGRRATVFAEDQVVKARNVALFVEQLPFIYLPWLSVADRRSPFFIIPGKKKPWEEFALMGYRYEWPEDHEGTVHLDWRRAFGWGVGLDHQFDRERIGKGLMKVYFNEERNLRRREDDLPKGADIRRYRVLWRHYWEPAADTSVITNIQEFSDVDFRRELLFRDEFTKDEVADSFVSSVTNTPDYSLSALVRKRMNRFDTADEAMPEVTFEVSGKELGDSQLFSDTRFDVANLETKRAHSDDDTDVIRVDWFQQAKYALNLFRPILVTPRAGVRQTYYTKDKQGGVERPQGKRDVVSGQLSLGGDASLKLFRIFPVTSDVLGLDINWLRHVLTPTVAYNYVHDPTVPGDVLNFSAASGATNQLIFGLENKLQTKRAVKGQKKPQNVDLARFLTSIPYTFVGGSNEQGGRLGDWSFDLELYPWPWMRLESDWSYPSHFVKGTRDDRVQSWNLDLVAVGGLQEAEGQPSPGTQAPTVQAFESGPRGGTDVRSAGQWYLGFGHRYSQNDKTEDVVQFDFGLGRKWEIGTFHRFTWKELASGFKRFENVREYQYSLRRDLHDWLAELVYRVDREFGEEVFFILTLKAYPNLPIEIEDSYHEPKIGSQSSPFSPLRGQGSGG